MTQDKRIQTILEAFKESLLQLPSGKLQKLSTITVEEATVCLNTLADSRQDLPIQAAEPEQDYPLEMTDRGPGGYNHN